MMPSFLGSLGNHLWQSTVFALVAGLLTLAFRRNHARVRYGLWLIASLKFLIPFSAVIWLGSQVEWERAPSLTRSALPSASLALAVQEIGQPFLSVPADGFVPATESRTPKVLLILWLCGCALVLGRWGIGWRQLRRLTRTAVTIDQGRPWEALRRMQHTSGIRTPIRLMGSPDGSHGSAMQPGVFGIFGAVLLLPFGIAERLSDAQLEAIFAHELAHVRRRDNLTFAIHSFVRAIFWFHPLVWWIGSRLLEERENACDEEVLRLGCGPQDYAEGILTVCHFCLDSPKSCVAGITGSNLKRRIEDIMLRRIAWNIDFGRKFLLAAAGCLALALPFSIGVISPAGVQGQSTAPRPEFEVASLKPSAPDARRFMIRTLPGGGIFATYVPLKRLIATAYSVTDFQILGDSRLLEGQKYDLNAKAPHPVELPQLRLMLQSLLDERFKLKFHWETKDLPIYSLVSAKGAGSESPGLVENPEGDCSVAVTPQDSAPNGAPLPACGNMNVGYGRIFGRRGRISQLADRLSSLLGRTVVDKTGLTGIYNVELRFTPDPTMGEQPPGAPVPDPLGPSIFVAIQQQLGLKLQAGKGPVKVIVIDSAEKLSGN